jgi:hypothetical protein
VKNLNREEELISKILKEKNELEGCNKNPRVILLGSKNYFLLEKNWIKKYYIIENNLASISNIYDGILLGLFAIKVDTIEGFEVR